MIVCLNLNDNLYEINWWYEMSFGNGLQTYCVLKLSMKFLYVLKSIV